MAPTISLLNFTYKVLQPTLIHIFSITPLNQNPSSKPRGTNMENETIPRKLPQMAGKTFVL